MAPCNGAANRNRTCYPLITNQMLYQMSYSGGVHVSAVFISSHRLATNARFRGRAIGADPSLHFFTPSLA